MVHPYNSTDTTVSWKKSCFVSSGRSDFHMINSQLIEVHTFARCILISLSVDEILLLRYVNLFTNFRGLPFRVEMAPRLKHMYSILLMFMWRPMPPAACSRLCSRDSAMEGVFARSTRSSASSAAVIVSTGYHLLLAFFRIKPFSFIRSIDVWSM